ncbi:MAG: flagellar hook-associated protein FlgK [Bilophila sp.]
MSGVNSLLNIGTSALSATQTAISVTGNNLANVNTDGYSRQNVRFEERRQLNSMPGMLGQGVNAAEIYRNFNRFVEDAYLSRSAQQSRWTEQATVLQSVESLFNEANRAGISSSLGDFFNDWQDLSLRPSDQPDREALLSNAQKLAQLVSNAKKTLEDVQHEMDLYIAQGVREVNETLESIKNVNAQIAANHVKGQSNANQLLDQRDALVRKLGEYIDVEVEDRGGGDFGVATKAGHTLVDGQTTFPLELRGERVENSLMKNSKYAGTMEFEGTDSQEYTFEITTPPTPAGADPTLNPAQPGSMRVSLDGGKTWLKNDDGSPLEVRVPSEPGESVKIKDITVSFNADTTKLTAGDTFEIIPKTGLYWVKPTRDPLNITPQTLKDGTDNAGRVTGGKLAAYFTVRDENAGRYIDKLDAFAKSLIWEVNAVHSQGASKPMTNTLGSETITKLNQALGLSDSGMNYADRLTEGNMSFQIYDKDGKPLTSGPLDFAEDNYTQRIDPGTGLPMTDADGKPIMDLVQNENAGIQNFDPTKHSLQDVTDAINRSYPDGKGGSLLNANIVDGKLQLTAASGTSFAVQKDSSGLLAGLGLNTMFSGSGASDIAIKSDVMQNSACINTGSVNADGTIKEGDAATAKAIAALATKTVKVSTTWEHSTQTLGSYYAGTVSLVGAESRTANFNMSYNKTLARDLDEQCSAISGVNLDEEMTNLIKFQHSYTAAAKLITTADQMLQTLLSLKQ